jgi:hypothetical protein
MAEKATTSDQASVAEAPAPSAPEPSSPRSSGKVAFEHGRRIERSVHEGTIATLKAENESLKGKLAGNTPSPTATNGSQVSPGRPTKFASMHEAYLAAAAEHGYPTRG